MDKPYTEPSTGLPQPPGGLLFALRCETGEPGQYGPVEASWQVAPVLSPGGNPALDCLPGGYTPVASEAHGPSSGAVGALNQVIGLLPGETGAKAQDGLKRLGHTIGNWLQSI